MATRKIRHLLRGEEFQDREGENPRSGIYRTGERTNLVITGVWLRLEDGERNVVPFAIKAGGETVLVVPQLEGDQGVMAWIPPTPVGPGVVVVLETLELPKIRPVRGWGTVWMEVDD